MSNNYKKYTAALMSKGKFAITFMVFMLCMTNKSWSQAKYFKYDWTTSIKHTRIPDSLKKKEAIVLFYNHFISLEAQEREVIHYRIKILHPNAIEDYSKLIIPKFNGGSFFGIDARTIKANGKVVQLAPDGIKKMAFNAVDDEDSYTQHHISIPGVEVGDEVEIYIKFELYGYHYIHELMMNQQHYMMNETLIVKSSDDLRVALAQYNGMPDPIVTNLDGYTTKYAWYLSNIEGYKFEPYSSPKSQLPFACFRILTNQNRGVLTNIFYGYMETFDNKNPIKNDYKFMKMLEEGSGVKDNMSSFQKVSLSYKYFVNQFKMIKELPANEQNLNLEFYLEKKVIDKHRMNVMFRQILDSYKKPYFLGIARNKYRGYLDPDFIYSSAVTDTYFMIEDDSSQMHSFFIGYDQFYNMDEFPFYLRGTDSYVMSRPNSMNEIKYVRMIEIPEYPLAINYRFQTRKFQINRKSDSLTASIKVTLSGDLSTYFVNEYKSKFDKVILNDGVQPFQIEEFSHEIPFKAKIKLGEKKENFVRNINAKSFSIPLHQLMDIRTVSIESGTRKLDYLAYFKYMDSNKIILVMDDVIESDNVTTLNKSFENEFVKTTCNVIKINEKTYSVEMSYALKESIVPASQIDKLIQGNKFFNDMVSSPLLFVVK